MSLEQLAINGSAGNNLLAQLVMALRNMRTTTVGSFTLSAAATTVVADTSVTANAFIMFTPTNAAAGSLMAGSKSLYLSTRSAGTSFTVATADGTSAGGTETFSYMIFAPL